MLPPTPALGDRNFRSSASSFYSCLSRSRISGEPSFSRELFDRERLVSLVAEQTAAESHPASESVYSNFWKKIQNLESASAVWEGPVPTTHCRIRSYFQLYAPDEAGMPFAPKRYPLSD